MAIWFTTGVASSCFLTCFFPGKHVQTKTTLDTRHRIYKIYRMTHPSFKIRTLAGTTTNETCACRKAS